MENKTKNQKVFELFYLLFQSAQLEVDKSYNSLDTEVNMKANELKHYLNNLVDDDLEEKYRFHTPELLEEAMLSVTKELASTLK